MRFGRFGLDEALGVRLAHSLKVQGRTLRKGRVLDEADLGFLEAQGVEQVTGARLGAEDIDEDAAAARAGALLAGPGVVAQPAARGRCNLKAQAPGVVLLDAAAVERMNRTDEALTVGTLPPFAAVAQGRIVATIKSIPFAVAAATLDAWRDIASRSPGGHPLRLAPLQPQRVALVLTATAATSRGVIDSTSAVTRARIEALGSRLEWELRCAHEPGAVADALAEVLKAGADLVLIAGASVSKDRDDTVPAGIQAAGGEIVHFGMPVEPGNMLLYAKLGATPVINLPGCARSRRLNGLDWMLQRLLARVPVSAADIAGMGVGGLIASGAEGGEEGKGEAPLGARPARIAAIVLAAGRSSRMGGVNKLLLEVHGVPMVRRAVDAALASQCVQTLVVTGRDAQAVEAALSGAPVSIVHNSASAEGMSTSLRCGLRALPQDIDGALILLADMPFLTAQHLDRLVAAFDPAAPGIVAPQRDGRRGNPVLWPRGYFGQITALRGDQGARALLERHGGDAGLVEVQDEAFFIDFDTPEAFAALTG